MILGLPIVSLQDAAAKKQRERERLARKEEDKRVNKAKKVEKAARTEREQQARTI